MTRGNSGTFPLDVGYRRKTAALLAIMNGRMRATISISGNAAKANTNASTFLRFIVDLKKIGVLKYKQTDNPDMLNIWDFDQSQPQTWGERINAIHPGHFYQPRDDEPIVRPGTQIDALMGAPASPTTGLERPRTPDPLAKAIGVLLPIYDALDTILSHLTLDDTDEAEEGRRALAWMHDHGFTLDPK